MVQLFDADRKKSFLERAFAGPQMRSIFNSDEEVRQIHAQQGPLHDVLAKLEGTKRLGSFHYAVDDSSLPPDSPERNLSLDGGGPGTSAMFEVGLSDKTDEVCKEDIG